MDVLHWIQDPLCIINTPLTVLKVDNPQVRLLYAPDHDQDLHQEPTQMCHYALISTPDINSIKWCAEKYSIIMCKRDAMGVHTWCLVCKQYKRINVDVIRSVLQLASPFCRVSLCGDWMSSRHADMCKQSPFCDVEAEKFEAHNIALTCTDLKSCQGGYYDLIMCDNDQGVQLVGYDTYCIYDEHGKVNYLCYLKSSESGLYAFIKQMEYAKSVKVVIISLQSKPNRRVNLKKQLDEKRVPYDLHYGCDGSSMVCVKSASQGGMLQVEVGNVKYDYCQGLRPNRHYLSKGEIGCAVSHLQVYDKIHSHTLTLVLEDDACIHHWTAFFHSLRHIPARETWDVINFQSEATWQAPMLMHGCNSHYVYHDKTMNLTVGYMIHKTAVDKLKRFMMDCYRASDTSIHRLCFPSDDLLTLAVQNGRLRSCIPLMRFVGGQHLPSHIDSVSSNQTANKSIHQPASQYYGDVWNATFKTITVDQLDQPWTGLGNQIWQFAVARCEALKSKRHFISSNPRHVQPVKLNLAFKYCQYDVLRANDINLSDVTAIEEKKDHVFTSMSSESSHVVLKGYFQNVRYFEGMEYVVREMFTFKDSINVQADATMKALREKHKGMQIVALHVRCNDVRNAHFIYNVHTPELINETVKVMKDKLTEPFVILAFSNDVDVARRIVDDAHLDNTVIIEWMPQSTRKLDIHPDGVMDMAIMSKCDHHIISASSFSWWAAYLACSGNQVVIAPRQWYNPKDDKYKGVDVSEMFPSTWTLI